MKFQLFVDQPSLELKKGIIVRSDTELSFKSERAEQLLHDLKLDTILTEEGSNGVNRYTSKSHISIFLNEGDILLFDPVRGYYLPPYPKTTVEQAASDLSSLMNVKLEEETPRFDELRAALERVQSKMWGVNTVRYHGGEIRTDRIEFTVRVGSGEDYIVSRLEREKRVGRVEQVGEGLYRFTADVIDVTEMVPWIRTFICRITELKCTNREIERKFKHDLNATYRLYGIGEEDSL